MRLLLVEDTARLIELMTEAVHDAGWQIDAVTTVQDAEEVLATTPYDLLLFDLGLPDGDGLDLVGQDVTKKIPLESKRERRQGLGLKIVQRIVEIHGGTFELAGLAKGGKSAVMKFQPQSGNANVG
jgi:two-component sensor histidine kinase